MADSLILLQRNAIPEGSATQTVDVLAHKDQGNLYWVWTVQGIQVSQNDNQVQAYLDTQVATVLAAISANNETPLTEEQLSNYQNIIDLQETDALLALLKANIDEINTATLEPTALAGWKAAFTGAAYNPLTNAAKFELIRITIRAILTMLVDTMKSVRILLKRAKRTGNGSALKAQ